MELFSKKTLAIATGIFSIYYAASTFIGGLGVDVVVTEPEECSLVKNLLPVRYTDNRFLTALVQKERAKKAGGDTVYLPIGVSNISSSQGYISGAAYDCSQVK
ncbi:hypothetical protein HF888_09100 [Bermanella marisrubri]|uniref:Uncharacterized protein n=1 Tax=Bermanella marisrubri TaxID=207949 RepID=Q1N6K4_9GAMM|nr:hypothetical protein [Bermanella marisrubri]EAT13588.1 hypothetical protein RED65_09359 [Oceanobacter sp. RED65] [Bermanella marisrubri]QIZ84376.1 hypothetical protein HF888_09100 [Bermanella marisrubri]